MRALAQLIAIGAKASSFFALLLEKNARRRKKPPADLDFPTATGGYYVKRYERSIKNAVTF